MCDFISRTVSWEGGSKCIRSGNEKNTPNKTRESASSIVFWPRDLIWHKCHHVHGNFGEFWKRSSLMHGKMLLSAGCRWWRGGAHVWPREGSIQVSDYVPYLDVQDEYIHQRESCKAKSKTWRVAIVICNEVCEETKHLWQPSMPERSFIDVSVIRTRKNMLTSKTKNKAVRMPYTNLLRVLVMGSAN